MLFADKLGRMSVRLKEWKIVPAFAAARDFKVLASI